MSYTFNVFSKISEFEAHVHAVEKFRQAYGLCTPQGRPTELFRVGFTIKAKCGKRVAKFILVRDCVKCADAKKLVDEFAKFVADKKYHVSVVSEFGDLLYMRGFRGAECGIMIADFSNARKTC